MAKADVPCLEIALVFEQRSSYLQVGYSEEDCAALAHDGEVEAVFTTLEKLGHHVTLVPGIQSLVQQLAAGNGMYWDLVFNMAQGLHGPAREAQVPALLEAYQIPCTFADAATMALCQNKAVTKMALNEHKIPNAPFRVIRAEELGADVSRITAPLTTYPLFVKLVTEGSSKGIESLNKINNSTELEPAVQELKSKFPGQAIMVESFLPGREFTVSILGTGRHSRVIGVREHIWQKPHSAGDIQNSNHSGLEFASRKCKSSKGGQLIYNDYHDMTDSQVRAACLVALDAWNAFGCRDAGRVDIRLDADKLDSVPNVLEVNPIAGLLPRHSPLPASAQTNGISFEKLLAGIVESTLQRTHKRVENYN